MSCEVLSQEGATHLHYASREGNVGTVQRLLDDGADVKAINGNGETALHWAALEYNVKIVQMLLRRGADANAPTKDGYTALHYAVWGPQFPTWFEWLSTGVYEVPHQRRRVEQQQLDANQQLDVLEALLRGGADIMVRSGSENTPLHLIAYVGELAVLRWLLTKETSMIQNSWGNTPLHLAVWSGNIEAVRALAMYTDQRLANEAGNTPLHVAIEIGRVEIINILLESGVDLGFKARSSQSYHQGLRALHCEQTYER
jgi:ankyrin repeat protein